MGRPRRAAEGDSPIFADFAAKIGTVHVDAYPPENLMDDPVLLEQAGTMVSSLLALMHQIAVPDDVLAAKLPLAQLRVCVMLSGGARSMSALGRELGVSLSAMTQIANRLERARLVRRMAGQSDRRIKSLQLTPRGDRIMRLRAEGHVGRASSLLQRLSPGKRAEGLAALETLANACRANGDKPLLAQDVGLASRAVL